MKNVKNNISRPNFGDICKKYKVKGIPVSLAIEELTGPYKLAYLYIKSIQAYITAGAVKPQAINESAEAQGMAQVVKQIYDSNFVKYKKYIKDKDKKKEKALLVYTCRRDALSALWCLYLAPALDSKYEGRAYWNMMTLWEAVRHNSEGLEKIRDNAYEAARFEYFQNFQPMELTPEYFEAEALSLLLDIVI